MLHFLVGVSPPAVPLVIVGTGVLDGPQFPYRRGRPPGRPAFPPTQKKQDILADILLFVCFCLHFHLFFGEVTLGGGGGNGTVCGGGDDLAERLFTDISRDENAVDGGFRILARHGVAVPVKRENAA